MTLKFFVLCLAVTAANAGILRSDLRYESPIIVSPPAIKYEIPPTSRVEHLAPVHSTSYGYSTVPLKHEVVAAPVARVAAVPAPVAIAAPTLHVQTPAISRIEHLAPAVASSYKTEVITAPKVHVTHTPAVARIEHVAPVVIPQPVLRVETPAITYRTEVVAAPSIAKIEHLAPALRAEYVAAPTISYAAAPIVARSELLAPALTAYKSHVIAEPSLRIAHDAPLTLGHSIHDLKHLSYAY